MGPRPARRAHQPGAAGARAAHPERREEALLHHLAIGAAGDPLDDLGRRIIGDVLVGVAGAGRADIVQGRERAAQIMRLHPVLELGVLGVAEQAERVREQVGDGRDILVAVRQAQRGGPAPDRIVERQPPVIGEARHHVRGDALGERGPAKHRVGGHPLAAAGEGDAIALDEADAPVLDDADREPDHRRILAEPLQPLVEPLVIDRVRRLAVLADRDVEAMRGRGGRGRHRRAEPQHRRPEADGSQQADDEEPGEAPQMHES